jgi:hypothetical protein
MGRPDEQMLRQLLGAVLAIALSAGASAAEGDRSPQSAVPSDVARGADAASYCESMAWSTEDYSSCIARRVAHAMDNDSASMAFQLGIYCSAFFKLAMAHRSRMWKQSPVDLDHAEVATIDQYGSCVFFARSLDLSTDRICTTLSLNCDVFNQMLSHWESVSRKGM